VQPAYTGAANILYRNLLLHAVCAGQEHIIQPFDVLHIYGTDVYRSYLPYTLTEGGTHVYEDLVCIYSKHLDSSITNTKRLLLFKLRII